MAKELPYFKFEPSEWDSGNIQMCSRESKGLFIDLCSLYWNRLGELPYALALQKLCNGNEDALKELVKVHIIGVVDGNIVIEFLEEQLSEFGNVSQKRRNAANKRWSDANAMQLESKSNAIRGDKIRGKKKKEEEKIVDSEIVATKVATIEDRQKAFMELLTPYLDQYKKEMLREFFDYWIEKNPNGRKMRFEMQKVFDIGLRLKTWFKNSNNGKFINKREQQTNSLKENFAKRVINSNPGEAI